MILLLDENLSPRLIARIELTFPGRLHVIHAGLDNSPDNELWCYAKDHGFAIVSKDKDFLSMLEKRGHPPKVIHLSLGNVRLTIVENTLTENKQEINELLQDSSKGLLLL